MAVLIALLTGQLEIILFVKNYDRYWKKSGCLVDMVLGALSVSCVIWWKRSVVLRRQLTMFEVTVAQVKGLLSDIQDLMNHGLQYCYMPKPMLFHFDFSLTIHTSYFLKKDS